MTEDLLRGIACRSFGYDCWHNEGVDLFGELSRSKQILYVHAFLSSHGCYSRIATAMVYEVLISCMGEVLYSLLGASMRW